MTESVDGGDTESANVDCHFKEFGSKIKKGGGRFISPRWGKTRNVVEAQARWLVLHSYEGDRESFGKWARF